MKQQKKMTKIRLSSIYSETICQCSHEITFWQFVSRSFDTQGRPYRLYEYRLTMCHMSRPVMFFIFPMLTSVIIHNAQLIHQIEQSLATIQLMNVFFAICFSPHSTQFSGGISVFHTKVYLIISRLIVLQYSRMIQRKIPSLGQVLHVHYRCWCIDSKCVCAACKVC